MHEKKTNPHKVFVGKLQGKRPIGTHSRRWEYNIKMDLRVMGWGGVDWMDMAQNRD
jgi:hypothetical protein